MRFLKCSLERSPGHFLEIWAGGDRRKTRGGLPLGEESAHIASSQ